MTTKQNKHVMNQAIEKLEQSKNIINDLIIEAGELEEWDFVDSWNDYTEDIQSIIDKITDDNELLDD